MLPFLDMSSAQALPYPTPFKRAARHPPAAGAARERPPRRRRPSRSRPAPGRPRAHLRPRPARGGGVVGENGAAPLGTCPAHPAALRGPRAAHLPLLLLPSRVEEQVPVPVLLRLHVIVGLLRVVVMIHGGALFV